MGRSRQSFTYPWCYSSFTFIPRDISFGGAERSNCTYTPHLGNASRVKESCSFARQHLKLLVKGTDTVAQVYLLPCKYVSRYYLNCSALLHFNFCTSEAYLPTYVELIKPSLFLIVHFERLIRHNEVIILLIIRCCSCFFIIANITKPVK